MKTPVSYPKFSSHIRSISLPSTSHPLIASAEEQLQHLMSFGSQTSSSCASACEKLDGLRTLYQCLDDVLQLSLSQQLLSQERCSKWEEEVMDGSLMLLDVCGSVRDIFLQKKESIQELESSLRRKRGGELETYMISKTNLNKMISKCHKGLKIADQKTSLTVVNKDFDTLSLIKEIQELTLKILQSSLSLVSQSKKAGWSLVSKVMAHKKASDVSEIEKMEVELQILNGEKSNKDTDVLPMLRRLKGLDLRIKELAEALEIVYRLLLKLEFPFSTFSTISLV